METGDDYSEWAESQVAWEERSSLNVFTKADWELWCVLWREWWEMGVSFPCSLRESRTCCFMPRVPFTRYDEGRYALSVTSWFSFFFFFFFFFCHEFLLPSSRFSSNTRIVAGGPATNSPKDSGKGLVCHIGKDLLWLWLVDPNVFDIVFSSFSQSSLCLAIMHNLHCRSPGRRQVSPVMFLLQEKQRMNVLHCPNVMSWRQASAVPLSYSKCCLF